MLKQSIVMTVLFVAQIACAQAVLPSTPVPQTSFPADAAPINPHKSRDAAFRACKNEADQQKLEGSSRSAFIAACVQNAPR